MSKKPNKKRKQKKDRASTHVKAKRSPSFWSVNKRWLWALGILILTFVAYSVNLEHDFVNWDDDRNFYENTLVNTFSASNFWDNTVAIFKTKVIGNYNPLTIWTFGLENMIYGLEKPGMWHLNNILLHLACVLLVFRLSFQLGSSRVGAIIVTILFAIHPMRVESVAWVTERKDVLYGVFYLAALVTYMKYRTSRSKKYFIMILCFFLLSLFSKIQAVILPLSMLCIDYYMDDQVKVKQVISKWPYFLLSLLFGLAGLFFLKDNGSLDTNEVFAIWERFFIGSYSYVVYLMKLFVPYELSPLYPYPSSLNWAFYLSMLALPVTLGLLWWAHKQQLKAIVFGLLFFIVNIVFLLQILGAGQGFLADRFTYIAYFGLFFIIGWGMETLLHSYPKQKSILYGLSGLYLLAMFVINVQQNKIWKNSYTMWSHVIKYYDKTTLPFGNRANYLRDNGRTQEALADYNRTIALKDEQPEAYNSRAKLYFNMGNDRSTLQQALNDYNKAIQYDPQNGEFMVNRGATYARLGDINKAIEDMSRGIELNPNHAVGYLNRSVMYNQLGNMPKALEDINSYLKLQPYNADMWYEKGRAMRQVNQVKESIGAFTRAIELNPKKGIYYYERARTLGSMNKIDEARRDLQAAIANKFTAIDPTFKASLGM